MCIERVLFIWKFDSHSWYNIEMFEKTVVCVLCTVCGCVWGWGGGGGGGVNVTIYIICNGYYHFLRRIYEFNFTFSK